MTIVHHLDAATLASYSAGNIGEALAAVVACHLDWCPVCAAELRRFEAIGGEMLRSTADAELSAGALSAVLMRLGDGDRPMRRPLHSTGAGNPRSLKPEIPRPLQGLIGTSLASIEWKTLAPGAKHIRLPLSDKASGNLHLLKVAAGQKLPEHGHGGSELTLVLRGAYADVTGTYQRGDVSDLDAEIEHRPIATADADCICLMASESKARFKSIVSRLLQPLIGL